MAKKTGALTKSFLLVSALSLVIVPLLRVAHRHLDDGGSCAAASGLFLHTDSGADRGQNAAGAISAVVDTPAAAGHAPDPNHSADTCATCQSLMQLSSSGIIAASPSFHALLRLESTTPQPKQATAARRHEIAILPRAPPFLS